MQDPLEGGSRMEDAATRTWAANILTGSAQLWSKVRHLPEEGGGGKGAI